MSSANNPTINKNTTPRESLTTDSELDAMMGRAELIAYTSLVRTASLEPVARPDFVPYRENSDVLMPNVNEPLDSYCNYLESVIGSSDLFSEFHEHLLAYMQLTGKKISLEYKTEIAELKWIIDEHLFLIDQFNDGILDYADEIEMRAVVDRRLLRARESFLNSVYSMHEISCWTLYEFVSDFFYIQY